MKKQDFISLSRWTNLYEILAGICVFLYLFYGGLETLLFSIVFGVLCIKSLVTDLIKGLNTIYDEEDTHNEQR